MDWVTDSNAALLTDLYELTMSASYHRHRMNREATFDLFVRELPPHRNFLVMCGLEQALDYLERLRFDDEAIGYLRSLEMFDEEFLEFLSELRFTGEVFAMPEGEVAFAGEPLVSVTGPLIEAQIVETFLLNCITFQTTIASKAARIAISCGDKSFVDYSPRRDHGADAALKAARAAYIAGASGTSNVLAGKTYGIPVSGTMAHSYVMAFENEAEAFRAYARDFPERAVFLIDTFDVEEGARRAARVAHELAGEGIEISGVRIDSGDLDGLTRSVRKILDDSGLEDTTIILSGDLDEYRIKSLLDDDVPADAFGVGTQLGTSADAPALGGVYKLVAESGRPKMKLSTGKVTLPGHKQVHRTIRQGCYERDVISLRDERIAGVELLQKVMERGRRTYEPESLDEIRDRCRRTLASLPESLRSLEDPAEPYPVDWSEELRVLAEAMREQRL